MNLVERRSWGARAPRGTPTRIATVEGVAVHWEGPPIGTPAADKCDDHVRQIQNFHMNVKDWADIAYNFVVCPHGAVFEGRGWGVRSAANGTNLANAHYHAVCYLGGTGDPFTSSARLAIGQLVGESRRRWPTGKAVRPHSSFRATDCPGNVIRAWLASNPFDIGPPPVPPLPPPEEDDMLIIGDGFSAWLITGGVRHYIESPEELSRLKAAGVKYVEAPKLVARVPQAT